MKPLLTLAALLILTTTANASEVFLYSLDEVSLTTSPTGISGTTGISFLNGHYYPGLDDYHVEFNASFGSEFGILNIFNGEGRQTFEGWFHGPVVLEGDEYVVSKLTGYFKGFSGENLMAFNHSDLRINQSGGTLRLVSVAPIPEPTSLVLMGAGLVGVITTTIRRKGG